MSYDPFVVQQMDVPVWSCLKAHQQSISCWFDSVRVLIKKLVHLQRICPQTVEARLSLRLPQLNKKKKTCLLFMFIITPRLLFAPVFMDGLAANSTCYMKPSFTVNTEMDPTQCRAANHTDVYSQSSTCARFSPTASAATHTPSTDTCACTCTHTCVCHLFAPSALSTPSCQSNYLSMTLSLIKNILKLQSSSGGVLMIWKQKY